MAWTPMALDGLDSYGLDPYGLLLLGPLPLWLGSLWPPMAWTPMAPYGLDLYGLAPYGITKLTNPLGSRWHHKTDQHPWPAMASQK